MSVAAELIGQTFTTTIYESVVGKIQIENVVLTGGGIFATIWVEFPDGSGDEVFSVQEAVKKLEL